MLFALKIKTQLLNNSIHIAIRTAIELTARRIRRYDVLGKGQKSCNVIR